AYVMGYKIAAKTGTSEKIGDNDGYICSCVAFAPSDDAEIAVIIMVDEPTKGSLYGSTVAAPYIGNFMETVLPYLGIEADYTDAELAKLAVKVSSYRGWSVSKATEYAKNAGLSVSVVGSGDVVTSQIPASGSYVEKASGRIILYTNGETAESDVVVPDVVGKTAVAANAAIVNKGLNIKIEGTKNYLSGTGATAVEQFPAAGEVVPAGTVVTVTFRYLGDEDYIDDEVFEDLPEGG
ncbi:MAG: PASTA domain-containing protein, partial [Clostridia bacterium]|nr:PASTA domain-containing protein [Clostridia bacterium]